MTIASSVMSQCFYVFTPPALFKLESSPSETFQTPKSEDTNPCPKSTSQTMPNTPTPSSDTCSCPGGKNAHRIGLNKDRSGSPNSPGKGQRGIKKASGMETRRKRQPLTQKKKKKKPGPEEEESAEEEGRGEGRINPGRALITARCNQ